MRTQVLAGLRARLLLLVGLATLPALAFILYSASFQRTALRRKIETDTMYLASLAAREHARQIAGASDLVATLAALPIEWMRMPGPCPEFFPAVLQGFRHFANLGVLAPDGTLVCSVIPPDGPVDMSALPVFARATQSTGVAVGEYQIGLIVHRPVLIVANAVRDAANGISALVFVALDLRWFSQLAQEADLPEGSSFTIVDRRGRILARSLESSLWVGKSLAAHGGFSQVISRQQGLMEGEDVDGVRRLFAFAPLAGIDGVFVMVGIPVEKAFADVNRALVVNLLGLGFITLCATAAGLLGAEVFVLRGIWGLARASRMLGAGMLTVRVPEEKQAGEISELARAFNLMANALEARHNEAITAQENLRASEERLRVLSQGLQEAREEERAQIARDLHDELGQSLTALKLDVSWMSGKLVGSPPSEPDLARMREGLHEMMLRLDETVHLVRRIATDLRPGVLDRLGLAAAVEWQAGEFQRRTGIRCELILDPLDGVLSPAVSTALFRICQEALTNIARHSKARYVTVHLRENSGVVEMSIHDDGVGIKETSTLDPQSIGILGMRERALLLGGSVSVSADPGEGTTVEVRIPRELVGGEDRVEERC